MTDLLAEPRLVLPTTDVIVGFDYETHLLGPENLTPKPICLSAYANGGEDNLSSVNPDPDTDTEFACAPNGDIDDLALSLILNDEVVKVGQNIAFDLSVACAHTTLPDGSSLYPAVFAALEAGRFKDVGVREKMLDLADSGDLEYEDLPDGTRKKKTAPGYSYYSLDSMVKRYLGISMPGKAKKRKGKAVGEEDAWRLNYDVLEDVPLEDWPADAITYSVYDSVYPTLIYRLQEKRRHEIAERIGMDPLKTEDFRTMLAFCLYQLSIPGVAIDAEEKERVRKQFEADIDLNNLPDLVKHGIISPAEPPKKSRRKDHAKGCPRRGKCDCPFGMTAGKPEKLSKKKLEAYVLELKKRLGDKITLKRTDPKKLSEKAREKSPNGNLSVDKEFLAAHAKLDPVLAQLQRRAAVQKIFNTEFPRMEFPHGSGQTAKVAHPSFDFLKATGRTSSYASSTYPSFGCQNVDPRVRGCYVPRPGWLMYSVDYNQMELVSFAQKLHDLFGHSVMADKINAGYDLHCYLGAQIALHLDGEFAQACREAGVETPDDAYQAFLALKDSAHDAIYKKYRKLAKPTGLGYPGGLGPATFVTFASGPPHNVDVDEDMAHELREIWRRTFPEVVDYFRWINDECYIGEIPGEDRPKTLYAYTTPFGLYRNNADYCATANGAGLQGYSGDGYNLSLIEVVRATYEPNGPLAADERGPRHRPLMAIHDEIVGEVREDVAEEMVNKVAEIMEQAFAVVTPNVTPRAKPALMFRWNKSAEPCYDTNGRLIPWVPQEEEK